MDYIKFLKEQQRTDALLGLEGAYAGSETPEQTAARMQKARAYALDASTVSTLTPEEDASEKAKLVNMANIQALAPVLTERMRDVSVANLVRSDLSEYSFVEGLVHRLAPEPNGAETLGQQAINSAVRSLYGISNEDENVLSYAKRYQAVLAKERRIAEGVSNAELFGSEDDPTGDAGRMYFDQNVQSYKENLVKLMEQSLEKSGYARDNQAFYPAGSAMDAFSKAETFGDATAEFFKNPLGIIANTLPGSMVDMAPAMGAMAAAGTMGINPTALALLQGYFSFATSKAGYVTEKLDELVNMRDTKAAIAFLTDPKQYETLLRLDSEKVAYGALVGAVDAGSMGVASKVNPLTVLSRGKFTSPFGNNVLQIPIQGALGGVGEAAGQLSARGEIYSYSDIVAEIGVGSATAPIEVASAGWSAYRDAQIKADEAKRTADAVNNLGEGIRATADRELDPETMTEIREEAAKREGIDKVYIDAETFKQMGLDKKFAKVQGLAEALATALANGERMVIGYRTFEEMVKLDGDKELAGLVTLSPEALTQAEAAAHSEQVKGNIAQQLDEARRASAKPTDDEETAFRESLKAVGQGIGNALREAYGDTVEPGEINLVTGFMQSAIGTIASEAGIDPSQIWSNYGYTFLSADRARDTNIKGEAGKGYLRRFYGADKSTLIHEMAHMFLSIRTGVAADILNNAEYTRNKQASSGDNAKMTRRQGYLDDINEMLKWLGWDKGVEEFVKLSTAEQEKLQEKFARSFEEYVKTGIPPKDGLKRNFRNFSRWMETNYAVANGMVPDSAFTEDVRAMFDAIFVGRQQAQAAAIRTGSGDFLTAEEKAGLSPMELAAYNEALIARAADAEMELAAERRKMFDRQNKRRAELIKEVKNGQNEDLNRIRKEIAAQYEDTPRANADEFMLKGVKENTTDGSKPKPVRYRLLLTELDALMKAGKFTFSEGRFRGIKQRLLDKGYALKSREKNAGPLKALELMDAFGYANLEEFLVDLADNEKLDDRIDRETVERYEAEHPLTTTAGESISDFADASLFNENALDIGEMEMAFSAKLDRAMVRQLRETYETLAYQRVSNMKYKDVLTTPYKIEPNGKKRRLPNAVMNFIHGAMTCARKAKEARAKGNMKSLIFYKKNELNNISMANALREARKEILGNWRRWRKRFKAEKIKGVAPQYLELIQRALYGARFDDNELKFWGLNKETITENGVTREKVFGDYFAELFGENDLVILRPELLAALNTRNTEYISTVDGQRQLNDLIVSIEFQGKAAQRIMTAQGVRDLDEFHLKAYGEVTNAAEVHKRKPRKERDRAGWKASTLDILKRIGLNHARAATVVEAMGSASGILFDAIIGPFQQAGDEEARLRNKYVEDLYGILKPVLKGLVSSKLYTVKSEGGLKGKQVTVGEVFFMLMNSGNEGNLSRLLNGFKHENSVTGGAEMTREQLMAVFTEILSEEHFAVANAVWGLFDTLRVDTDKTARQIMGRAPLWVEPTKFELRTSAGKTVTLNGGYYPVVYDRKASTSGNVIGNVEDAKSMTSIFQKGGVADGHLKARVKDLTDPRPLTLTSDALFSGLDEQIHYVAWAVWVNNMRKILSPRHANKETGEIPNSFDTAVRRYWGAAYCDFLARWVRDCANGNKANTSPTDGLANLLRRNISMAGVGFNLVTAIVQPVGMLQSVVRIGGTWCARGIAEYLKLGPIKAAAFASGKSKFMADRSRTQFRELTEIQARFNGQGEFRDTFMRWAYKPIVWVQLTVDVPTWLGAYQKALAEGFNDDKAILLADRAVIDAQGSGRVQDLSELERGNAWSKLMTVYYTFFNTALNLAALSHNTKGGAKRAADLMILLVMQPVIETFLRAALEDIGEDTPDDEDFWMNMMKKSASNVLDFNLGLFVVLRELSGMFSEYNNYRGPGGLRKISDIRNLAEALSRDEYDEKTLRAAVSATGSVFGVPAAAFNRAITGYNKLESGESDNPLNMFIGL